MQNSATPSQSYNYSALSDKVTLGKIIHSVQEKVSKPVFFCYIFLLITVPAILVFAIAGMGFTLLADTSSYNSIVAATTILTLSICLGLFFYSWIKSTKQRIRIEEFAHANNFAYLDSSNASTDNYNGMMFNAGHARTVRAGIKSTTNTLYEFANCSYVTGGGKNSKTHYFGFVRIKLPRRLPHMVLDATANNLFKRFSNLPKTFNSNQKLSLEGDFDKYFTLYAPAEYKTDALYVFTPDIMQLFIVNAHTFDAEVIDDDLYLYTSGSLKLDNAESLQALFELVDKIYPKLHNQTDYYSDERIGNRVANIVAPAGSRLKSRFSYVVVAFFIFVFLVQILPSIIRMFFN